MENYECGTKELIALREIVAKTPHVLGARFSGAGFRGCVIGIIPRSHAKSAADTILRGYVGAFPQYKGLAEVYVFDFCDGIRGILPAAK